MPALRLATVFGTGMVLQQKTAARLFGFAKSDMQVTVELERFPAENRQASESQTQYGIIFFEEERADRDGYFEFRLPPLKASYDSYRLTVRSGVDAVIVDDILAGEVWYAAGQDNMSQTVRMSDAEELLPDCVNLGSIRFFQMNLDGLSDKVPEYSYMPLGEAQGGEWQRGDQSYLMEEISAIAFSFARELHYELDIPVGVINAACPGTYIHAWLPREIIETDPIIKNHVREVRLYRDREGWNNAEIESPRVEKEKAPRPLSPFPRPQIVAIMDGRRPDLPATVPVVIPRASIRKSSVAQDIVPLERVFLPRNQPAAIFNHKVAPFVGLSIRGILWMQGENDVDSPEYYLRAFGHLIDMFNEMFESADGELDLIVSQLPPYLYRGLNAFGLAVFNEMLARACRRVPARAGLITVYDLSPAYLDQDYYCAALTPYAKLEIGRRMSVVARGLTDGGDLPVSAPQPIAMERIGNKWMIDLSPSAVKGHGLQLRQGENILKGFAVCDASRVFVKAEARILYGVRVLVWHDQIEDPVSLTYAFSAFNSEANLYGADGIPVLPFRFDLEPSAYLAPMAWADCDRLTEFSWTQALLRDSLRSKKKTWPGQNQLWEVTGGGGKLELTGEIHGYGSADIRLDYWNADERPVVIEAAVSHASAYPPLDLSVYTGIELTVLNPDHQRKTVQLLLEDTNGVFFESQPAVIEDAFRQQILVWSAESLAVDTSRVTRLAFRLMDPGGKGSLIFIRVNFPYRPEEE
ncbi:MAG TPA: hypothetical protein PK646_01745 [Bacillota bacterium]|jgi:sialate O-acetylesterase|nr:hypothetical protein [Fastidiosipila sp.]HPX92986.1 hypothetical protein [Bacillota bacterium]HQB80800.1 hypothetical protein [Bacillota bacterium]